MDNTGIRSRSKKYRRRVRNIRVGLTLFCHMPDRGGNTSHT